MSKQPIARRDFIKLLGLLAASMPGMGQASPLKKLRFANSQVGVLQGATNRHSTQITVVIHKTAKPVFRLESIAGFNGHIESQRHDMKLGDFVVYHLFISGLELGPTYKLSIQDAQNHIQTNRSLKALDLENPDPKVAVVSCMNHGKAEPQFAMSKRLREAQPDVIYFIGDMVYANRAMDTILGQAAPPEKAYELYVKTFLSLEWYAQDQLIPSFSIWDDHDMGKDNATSSHPNLTLMSQMFRIFFPLTERISQVQLGPGMSFELKAFGMQNLFLDGRSFLGAGRFLGPAQTQWFQQAYRQSSDPALLICSQQFWQYNKINESFQRASGSEFTAFLQFLKQNPKPQIFVAGDVHYSQIQVISESVLGYPTYELTSSALFSSSMKNLYLRSPEEGQIGYYGMPNLLLLDQIRADSQGLDLRVTCISDTHQQFQKTLSV